MNLDWPEPNVTCRCGQTLWSWAEVQEHFRRHRDTQDHMAEFQKRFDEEMKRPYSFRWPAQR